MSKHKSTKTTKVPQVEAKTIESIPQTIPLVKVTSPSAIVPEKTVAEKIWLHIKDVRLDMFGLPSQTISKYCSPVPADPNKLFLSYKVGAVLPAMESVLTSVYDVELYDKYITVSHKRKI